MSRAYGRGYALFSPRSIFVLHDIDAQVPMNCAQEYLKFLTVREGGRYDHWDAVVFGAVESHEVCVEGN